MRKEGVRCNSSWSLGDLSQLVGIPVGSLKSWRVSVTVLCLVTADSTQFVLV